MLLVNIVNAGHLAEESNNELLLSKGRSFDELYSPEINKAQLKCIISSVL